MTLKRTGRSALIDSKSEQHLIGNGAVIELASVTLELVSHINCARVLWACVAAAEPRRARRKTEGEGGEGEERECS